MKRRLYIILLALTAAFAGVAGLAACDDKKEEEHVHDYGEWVIVKDATCTESGERRKECSCGDFKTEEIYSLGHDLETRPGGAYGCEINGWKEYQACKREGCDYSTYEIIPKHHDYNLEGYCVRCDKPQSDYHFDAGDDNATYLGRGDSTSTEVVIPSTVRIDGVICKITAIGDGAFQGTDITSVVIPEGVTAIGANVFENCKNLTEVVIPDSVESIGTGAFDGCDNIKYNVKSNGCYLGSESKPYRILAKIADASVTSFVIEENVEIACFGLFSECANLKSVTVANKLNSFDSLFTGCISLESVSLPENSDVIGNYMFQGCESLKTLKIPESVTEIGNSAFASCGLTEIEIPVNVTSIGENAFESTALKALVFSSNPSQIGENAFGNCQNLEYVMLPEGLTKVSDYLFAGSANLKYVYIPNTVKEIGASVFDYCGDDVKIFYNGTAEEWAKVSLADTENSISDIVYFYSASAPSDNGNYWSWSTTDGSPVIWQTQN